MISPRVSNEAPEDDATLGLQVRRVTIPSGDIAYIDEGNGPVVLLIHGGPLTSLGFVRVVRGLRDQYRVIAPDLPGFGKSREHENFAGSLSEYARSIRELCTNLKLERLVLFGCDAGACIGLAAATKMASAIAGLVVADTVPFPLTGRAWLVKAVLRYVVTSRLVRFLNRRFNLLPWLVVTLDPLLHPFSARERAILIGQYDSCEKRDRILDVFSALGHDDRFMCETAGAIAQYLAETPALLLFGQLDPVRFVGGVSRFRKMFPRSTVAIIRKEKHFPILARGEEVAAVMKSWMRTLESSRQAQPRRAATASRPVIV